MISSRQFVAARKDTPRRHVPSPAHDGDEDRISKTISASQVQQIQQNPGALSTAAVLHLQRTIGNQATLRLLSGGKPKHCAQGPSGNPQITQPSATETIQRLITSKQLSKRAGSPIVAEPGFTQYSQILNKLRTYHSFIVANTLGQEGSIEPSDINQFQIQTKTRLETVREACQAYLRIVVDESPRRTHISGILDDVKQEVLAINAVVAARKGGLEGKKWRDVFAPYKGKSYKYVITDVRVQGFLATEAEKYPLDVEQAPWIRFKLEKRDQLPIQGWKLHVTADADSMVEVIRTLHHLLKDGDVPYKFAAGLQGYDRIAMDDTQVGKVVTIFPPRDDGKEYLNTEQAKTIIQSIDTALSGRGLTGPSVSGEQSVGTCRLIYARYGALKQTKENEYGDKLRVLDKLGDPTSNWEEDERSRIKPTWIPELVI